MQRLCFALAHETFKITTPELLLLVDYARHLNSIGPAHA